MSLHDLTTVFFTPESPWFLGVETVTAIIILSCVGECEWSLEAGKGGDRN